MGSLGLTVLDCMRKATQVDIDSFDAKDIVTNGPYQDATSNQFAIYEEMCKPENADMLQVSIENSLKFEKQFEEVSREHLAIDIFSVLSAIRVAKVVHGDLHLMASPRFAFSKDMTMKHAQRYHKLLNILAPDFDPARLVVKVSSTWEGLQACHTLRSLNIKTLATTVFSLPQAILGAEAGCVSVSPFIHNLKFLLDDTSDDEPAFLGLGPEAQRYFDKHGLSTKVKFCANKTTEQILSTYQEVAAFTILPDDAQAMSEMRITSDMNSGDLGTSKRKVQAYSNYKNIYLSDEARYRIDFAASFDGESQFRTMQSIDAFCDYQRKMELLVRNMLQKKGKQHRNDSHK